MAAYQQGCHSSQWGAFFSRSRAPHGEQRSGIATGSRVSPANALSQGSLVRLPLLDLHLQLKFLVSFLRGQLTNHGTPPSLLTTRSNPFRPLTIFLPSPDTYSDHDQKPLTIFGRMAAKGKCIAHSTPLIRAAISTSSRWKLVSGSRGHVVRNSRQRNKAS